MDFDPGSRSILTPRDVGRFPSESLFDRLGRAVCAAECLPRKELYESWEVARRMRRRMRGGRVVDLACGHGLTAAIALLLDASSEGALAIDARIPASSEPLFAALVDTWPRLRGRVERVEGDLATVELAASDVVVSVHACGALTDVVLAKAVAARAKVAVLPCCHDVETCDTGGLEAWMDAPLAIDAVRATRLRAHAYRVHLQSIPEAITPKNRLLLGVPVD